MSVPSRPTSSAGDPKYSAAHAAMRASDADRDAVAEVLREAFAEGRLDVEEHTERIERAYNAKTLGELAPLLTDLPAAHLPSGTTTSHAPANAGQQPIAHGSGAKVLAFFGESHREGRWIVEAETVAAAVFGEVTLDLREAVLSRREVVITANAVFGQVTIKVPHGVIVRDEGSAILGSRSSNAKHAGNFPVTPETPVIVIRGVALFGEVAVRYPKLPREGFFGRRG